MVNHDKTMIDHGQTVVLSKGREHSVYDDDEIKQFLYSPFRFIRRSLTKLNHSDFLVTDVLNNFQLGSSFYPCLLFSFITLDQPLTNKIGVTNDRTIKICQQK